MTSDFGAFGKRGTTGLAAGSVVPEFPQEHPGLPGGKFPTEVFPGRSTGDISGQTRSGRVRVGRGRACTDWADPGRISTGPVVLLRDRGH